MGKRLAVCTFVCWGLLSVFLPAQAADDLLDCVDPDVRHAFLENYYEGEMSVTADIAPLYQAMKFPDYLSPIGTMEKNGREAVAYSTRREGVNPMDDIAAVLLKSGWKDSPRDHGLGGGGFQSAVQPQYRNLCSPDNWSTMLNTRRVDVVTYVTVGVPQAPAGGHMDGCSDNPDDPITRIVHRSLRRYMPVLKMPEDASTDPRQHHFVGFGGGSSEDVDTKTRFETSLSSEQLAAFFGVQLTDQGWRSDASWSGSVSTGSTWVNTAEDDSTLTGELVIIDEGETSYYLVFTLRKLRNS